MSKKLVKEVVEYFSLVARVLSSCSVLIYCCGGIVMEKNTFSFEKYVEKFKTYTYTKKALLFILWAVIIAVIGLLFICCFSLNSCRNYRFYSV